MAGTDLHWQLKRFDELSVAELYAVLKLRQDVFIVEQMCPFPDIDQLDQQAWHLWAEQDGQILAYLRLLPPSDHNNDVALGRVCTATSARVGGLGRQLVVRGLQALKTLYPQADCVIGAQTYLTTFYQRAGFEVFGEPYLEDGIPHRKMRCALATWQS